MANKKKTRKQVDFNSPVLHAEMLEEAYKTQPRWFERVDAVVLENFGLKYATKVWNVAQSGNPASVVASYPRPNGKVLMVDLDSGDKFWVKLSKLTSTRVTRRADERDYEYSYVRDSDFECEVEDIAFGIDWSSIRHFDRTGDKDGMTNVMAKLVAMPKGWKKPKE